MAIKQRFAGQAVAITGASSGIGRAAAIAFAQEGARVALGARRIDRLEETAVAVRAVGGEAICVATDVTRRADVDALVGRTLDAWGRLDVMVNNAGVGLLARVLEIADEDFAELFRVNVLGALHGMQAAGIAMRLRGGVIVNVSSVVGKRAMPGNGAYCATKFALQALSDSLRVELGGSGIHVVVVCPGLTDTEFNEATKRGPNAPQSRPKGMKGMTAERAARELVDATFHRERERVLTFAARAVVALERLSPSLTDRAVRRVMKHRL
ncbi:MAG: SDR family NAD(P)-dependent oxidoreductase [Myxococcales bacterium]|nr:SDR family NAD(P)-dependent oxidoreductase [Myxococcales bacterium]